MFCQIAFNERSHLRISSTESKVKTSPSVTRLPAPQSPSPKLETTRSLQCDLSNETYSAVIFRGTVYYAVQGGSKF